MIQKAKCFIFSDKNFNLPTTVVYHESILPLPFLICSWDQRTTFIFVKGLLDWPLHNGACWNEAFSAICGNAAEALLKPQCSVHQGYRNRYNLIESEHRKDFLYVMRKDPWLSSDHYCAALASSSNSWKDLVEKNILSVIPLVLECYYIVEASICIKTSLSAY